MDADVSGGDQASSGAIGLVNHPRLGADLGGLSQWGGRSKRN